MVRLNPYSAVQKRRTLLQAIKGRRLKTSTPGTTDKIIDGKKIKKRSYATVVRRAQTAKLVATTTTTVVTKKKVAVKTVTAAPTTTTKTTTTKST